MQEHLAAASDLRVCVSVCVVSGQVWRQSGRAGLVIEEAIEKGASH